MIQETAELFWVTMLTVPETVAPLAGEVMLTAGVGVGVGLAVWASAAGARLASARAASTTATAR